MTRISKENRYELYPKHDDFLCSAAQELHEKAAVTLQSHLHVTVGAWSDGHGQLCFFKVSNAYLVIDHCQFT